MSHLTELGYKTIRLERWAEVYNLKYNKGCNKIKSYSQNWGKEMTHLQRWVI